MFCVRHTNLAFRSRTNKKAPKKALIHWITGGSCEIRTHGGLTSSPVFKTGAFNRSAKLPCWNSRKYCNRFALTARTHHFSGKNKACKSLKKSNPSAVGTTRCKSRVISPFSSARLSADCNTVTGNPVRSEKSANKKPSGSRNALSMNSNGKSARATSSLCETALSARDASSAWSINIRGSRCRTCR